MAGDLEQSGLQFVAPGADTFTKQVNAASKAVDDFNKSVSSAGSNSAGGALGGVADQLGSVASGAEAAAGALGATEVAGAEAALAISAGLSAALPVIAVAVIAIGGLVATAIAAHAAMESALNFGGTITGIQQVTGLSSDLAQELNIAAGVGGKSVKGLANDFLAVGDAADSVLARQEQAFNKAGASADKFGSRLQRLNEDYERSMSDIAQRLAERQAEINSNLEQAQVTLNDRLTQLSESYSESVADARASLNQRLSDSDQSYAESVARINERLSRLNDDHNRTTEQGHADLVQRLSELDSSYADSVAALNERLSRLDADYARNAEDAQATLNQRLEDLAQQHSERVAAISGSISKAEKQLADKRESIEGKLAADIAKLNQNTQSDIETEQAKGAKTQASIQEDLQKELASIAQKYTQQRASLEEKIADPNTNPILRAYYQTQVESLKKVQAAAEASATEQAQSKEQQAAAETAAAIQALKDQLAQEKALKEQAAAEDIAQAEAVAADRIATLQAQLAQENAEYQQQTARINAEYLKRQADRQRVYEQERSDLLAQLASESADYAQQTERINAEYAAREAERQRVYQQQQADLQAQLANEAAQHAQQTARLKAEETKREADLRKSYDQQTADAQAAYQKQVANAAEAQAKILAETTKRIANEKLQYERGIQDATTAIQTGGAAAVQAVDPVAQAFEKLGINVKEYAKLTPDEKFKALSSAVQKFVDEGKGQEAIDILSKIMGREKAAEYVTGITDMNNAVDRFKQLGLIIDPEDIKNADQMRKNINTMTTASDLLWVKVGNDLLPIWAAWLRVVQQFWQDYGPSVIRVLETLTSQTVPAIVGAIGGAWQAFNDFLTTIDNVYNFISGSLTTGFNWVQGAITDVQNVLAPLGHLFESVGNVQMAAVHLAATALAGLWQHELLPAFQAVESFLNGALTSAFNWVTNNVLPPFNAIFNRVADAFRVIGEKIDGIAGKINGFAQTLGSIQLPWWLTPGSPTPFEWGLRGIDESMKMLERSTQQAFTAMLDTTGNVNVSHSFTQPPSFQQPASFSQQAAGNTFNNSTSTASIALNFYGQADKAQVRDATYEALTRAGYQVVH